MTDDKMQCPWCYRKQFIQILKIGEKMTAETQKSHVQNRVTCCVTVREAFKQCHAMNFAKTSSIKLDSETCFKSHPSEFQANGRSRHWAFSFLFFFFFFFSLMQGRRARHAR